MTNHIIKVDKEKCIGCSLCEKDCVSSNIELCNKKAEIKSQGCIMCGHCVAICPKKAVSITGYDEPSIEFTNQTLLNPDELSMAIKTRRSIRHFKDNVISDDVIKQIIEVGRFTPTAKNAQDISYVVLNKNIKKYESIAVKVFKKLMPIVKIVYPPAKKMIIDDNFFFKKAPVAILILSKDKVSGSLAASNMSLMAESLGLGVLYSGFFTIVANASRTIKKELKIKGKKVITTLVIGYPNVEYLRTAQRNTAEINWN